MQDKFNNAFSNPQFLAGLAMIRGVPADQAYGQAALQIQQQQQAQIAQQEQQRRQYALQNLPQIAQKIQGLPLQEAFGELVGIGLDPKEALLILQSLGKQEQNKVETFTGPNNVRYQSIVNPETGELEAKPLPGQSNNMVNLSPAEIRINAQKLKELDESGRNAQRELRLLEDSDKAFEKFDQNTGSYTGPGTLASKFVPKGVENLLYGEDARTAKQEIDKLNSQLFQNRVAALGAKGTDTAKKEILKGLPSIELTPEARKDLLNTKKRENYEQILRARFFNEWAKLNNKDLNSAEDAFGSFLNSADIIDENGKINKELYNQIPTIVNEYNHPKKDLELNAEKIFDEELSNIPLKVLLEERKRRMR